MRNEKTSAAAIKAVQNNIGCQTALIEQVEELVGSFAAPPEGTVSITENGTHDVSGAATAEVDVQTHFFVFAHGDGTTSLQLPAKALARRYILVYAPVGIGGADSGVLLLWIYDLGKSGSRVCYTDSDGIYRASYDTLTVSGSGLITVSDECGVFPEEIPYNIIACDY